MDAWMHPTRWGRVAAVLTGLLALLHLAWLGAQGPVAAWLAVLGTTLCLVGLAAALGLWRSDAFEWRLLALVLAAGTLGGQLLVAAVGEPGDDAGRWSVQGGVHAGLSIALLVIIAGRSRRRTAPEVWNPYA